MRFYEISSGFRVVINGEEQKLLDRFNTTKTISKSDLSEREFELALKMVSRGLLDRRREGEKFVFVPNDPADLWRY